MNVKVYYEEFVLARERISIKQMAQTLLSVFWDFGFDLRYGTDTASWTDLTDLTIASENLEGAQPYHQTRARPFREVMAALALPKDCTFVDFGSGKGRVLLLALDYGFEKVVGIDFAAELCAVAQHNIDTYKKNKSGIEDVPVSINNVDAVDYRIEPDQRVFYLFHPFSARILTQVIGNINRSLAEAPRQIWVIYLNPEFGHVIEREMKEFEICLRKRAGGADFVTYTNRASN
jgi:SAM-dependent methyltransferase